ERSPQMLHDDIELACRRPHPGVRFPHGPAGIGAGGAGDLPQLVGDLLQEPGDVGPRELPVGPVIAPNAGHPRFRQRVDRVEPAEPVVQRLRRLGRHLLPPTSPREAIALLRAGKPPRPPAEVTRGRYSRWRVTVLRLALRTNADPRRPDRATDVLRALALSLSTATRAHAGG